MRHLVGGFEVLHARDQPHATAAAAGYGLDHDRQTNLRRHFARFGDTCDRTVAARDHGASRGLHRALGLGLVPHFVNHLRWRTDPDQLMVNTDLGKIGVFGEETIAGMNRVGVGDFGRRNECFGLQIALRRWRRTDADGFVGKFDMQRIAVRSRADSDGFNAEFAAGADNPQRDLSPVGDKHFIKH